MRASGRLGIALLLSAGAVTAPARADDEACRRTIGVTGRAEAVQAPDFAEVRVGVEARAERASAALDATSKAVAGIVALGRELGVAAADIGTAAVVLEPTTRVVTKPNGASHDEPDGYRAGNHVTLRLADMNRLGDLLRRALDVGANRIDAITFGLNEPDKVEAALRIAAAKDAKAQASALADAVGASLGGLCTLATAQGSRPMAMQASRVAASPKRVPIEAGTITSVAEVVATFAVRP